MCAVPNMAVVCSALISCSPVMLLTYCLSACIISIIIIIVIIIITTIKSRISWEGHVERMGRNAYRVSAGKPESNRPLEKPMRRWINPRANLGLGRLGSCLGR